MRDPQYFCPFSVHHLMTSVCKVAPQEGPVTQSEPVNVHNNNITAAPQQRCKRLQSRGRMTQLKSITVHLNKCIYFILVVYILESGIKLN